jgi:hypothetical protein
MRHLTPLSLLLGSFVGLLALTGCVEPEPEPEDQNEGVTCTGDEIRRGEALSTDMEALRERWNSNKDLVRFLFIGEPLCGTCVAASNELLDFFDAYDDDRVRIDWVWGPAWGYDTAYARAQSLMPVAADGRARVWYDEDKVLIDGMVDDLSMAAPIYDIHMVYAPGSVWESGGTPGVPEYTDGSRPEEAELEDALDEQLPTCDRIVTD